jgi:hypothetical protein
MKREREEGETEQKSQFLFIVNFIWIKDLYTWFTVRN